MFPEVAMLSHAQVWGAIDALAQKYGMTPSGLARKAGLDATTFNKSKRQTGDGRQRWPSTESISKLRKYRGRARCPDGRIPRPRWICLDGG